MDIVYKNKFVRITKKQDDFYIESFEKGFTISDINRVLNENPEIKITSISAIRDALLKAPQPPVKFGEAKERIKVEITDNGMKAFVTLSVDETERSENNRSRLISEIILKLREKGVIFGIKSDQLLKNIQSEAPFLAAEGIYPVNGEDSVIKMYELKDPQPKIKDDGRANFYELSLINKVDEGEWLGERTDPTEGIPGKNIKGEVIKPLPGKRLPLFYDPATVREEYRDGVTTLYSKIKGAVHYTGDRISVSNYLEITQDVGFNTGNIDFDGFLTIKGTIADNFSVSAGNDVEILGEFGIGNVKDVISRNGNILIKGGIAGKSKAIIKSTKDIYTKFISDATVICEGTVNVGYYCMNSNIIAKQLIVESLKGHIIGGEIRVEQKVSAAFIGNAGEKRTRIIVTGFDRKELKERLENLQASLHEAKNKLAKAKQLFSIYSYTVDVGSRQYGEYEAARENYFAAKDEVKYLEKELKAVLKCFKVKGEGEVSVTKKIYPNTCIEMGDNRKEIKSETLAATFYLQDGTINEI